jgi:hypothetical protein
MERLPKIEKRFFAHQKNLQVAAAKSKKRDIDKHMSQNKSFDVIESRRYL